MKNPSAYAAAYIKDRRMPFPIIDAHTHMGPNYGTYMSMAKTDDMIALMDKENIEMIFCAPHSALFDPGMQNNELELAMAPQGRPTEASVSPKAVMKSLPDQKPPT